MPSLSQLLAFIEYFKVVWAEPFKRAHRGEVLQA
jgi:hypothetical protein